MNLTTAVSEGAEQGRLPEGDRRRRRRLIPVAAVTAALLVAVAVGLATRPDGVRTKQVASEAEAGPSTTTAPEPAATPPAAGAGASTVPAGPRATTAPEPTTAPKPVVAPDRSRPAGMTYEPQAVWPETLAELDRLQAAVDQGQEPWRNDPVEVARAYLRDRGLPAPGLASFRAGAAGAGDVDYTSAGRGGTVHMQHLVAGSIW